MKKYSFIINIIDIESKKCCVIWIDSKNENSDILIVNIDNSKDYQKLITCFGVINPVYECESKLLEDKKEILLLLQTIENWNLTTISIEDFLNLLYNVKLFEVDFSLN